MKNEELLESNCTGFGWDQKLENNQNYSTFARLS